MRSFLLLLVSIAHAAPCISTSCTEWIALGNGQSRSLVYRTYPLDMKNEGVTRALVVIHGAGRDADNYFRSAVAAAFLAAALDNTLVISPRFASDDNSSCRDSLAANEVNWPCSGDSWRSGGVARNDEKLTSFDFADEILRRLARKDIFPNLAAIVVAGHSAGGQFVTRYEMANQVHDQLGVPVTYLVANPSAYAYLDNTRPAASAYAVSAGAPGYVPTPAQGASFRVFSDGRNCTTFDQWPYGLQNRSGYTSRLTSDQLKRQLVARPTVYLLGELDILPLGGFDSSCPAMAQGPTRLARGQAFHKYVTEKFGAAHSLTMVPLCGHNARCMFTAEIALPILFPKPGKTAP